MNGKKSKAISRLSYQSWQNFPPPVQARFSASTVNRWFKKAYQKVPRKLRYRWLRLVERRVAGGFSPVSPRSLMPK